MFERAKCFDCYRNVNSYWGVYSWFRGCRWAFATWTKLTHAKPENDKLEIAYLDETFQRGFYSWKSSWLASRMKSFAGLHYGNTGYGVSSTGINDYKDLFLKINIMYRNCCIGEVTKSATMWLSKPNFQCQKSSQCFSILFSLKIFLIWL